MNRIARLALVSWKSRAGLSLKPCCRWLLILRRMPSSQWADDSNFRDIPGCLAFKIGFRIFFQPTVICLSLWAVQTRAICPPFVGLNSVFSRLRKVIASLILIKSQQGFLCLSGLVCRSGGGWCAMSLLLKPSRGLDVQGEIQSKPPNSMVQGRSSENRSDDQPNRQTQQYGMACMPKGGENTRRGARTRRNAGTNDATPNAPVTRGRGQCASFRKR